MDDLVVSDMLEALADPQTLRRTSRQISSLRGVRGTPNGEVARISAAVWQDMRPELPADRDALSSLFGTAWEDGLVSIGLVAALVPDDPEECLDLALDWAPRVDDLQTADALGWLVIGPAALALQRPILEVLGSLAEHRRDAVRRMCIMTGMAMTSAPIEGPAAAPLRERLDAREVRITEAALSASLAELASRFVKDDRVPVRKGLRRVLRAWSADDPEALVAWSETVSGGLPAILGAEVKRAARRAKNGVSAG